MPIVRCPTCAALLQPVLATLDQSSGTLPAIALICPSHDHVVLRPLERLVALAIGEAVGTFLRWGAA
jgi:hypothetical protein